MIKTKAYINLDQKLKRIKSFSTIPSPINIPVILEWPKDFKFIEMKNGSMMLQSPAGDIVTKIHTEIKTQRPYILVKDNDYKKIYLEWHKE